METMIRRYRPLPFFALYFLLSWVPFWIAVLAARGGQPDLADTIFILGGVGAALTPLILIYTSKDRALVRDYWRRIFEVRRITPGGWIAILLTIPALTVGAVAISTLFGDSWDQLAPRMSSTATPGFFGLWALLIVGAIAEEIALRGYGIDALRSRMNLFKASVILGLLWALWHVPLAFLPGSFQNELIEQPLAFAGYWVWMIPTTIFYSWLFYRNHRSTLAAIVFHFMTNFVGEVTGMEEIARFAQAMLMIALVIVLLRMERGLFFREEIETTEGEPT
jgi:uncharacterized protein